MRASLVDLYVLICVIRVNLWLVFCYLHLKL
jgi:hypothetical protein